MWSVVLGVVWSARNMRPFLATNYDAYDFRSYYFAAKAFVLGGDIYDASYLNALSRSAGMDTLICPYLYPPLLAELLGPLAHLRFAWAARIFIFGQGIALGIGTFATLRIVRAMRRSETLGASDLMPFLLLFVLPFAVSCQVGQVNCWIVCAISIFAAFELADRPRLAGTFLAVAILIKASPVLLVGWLLARRRIRTMVSTAVASVSLFVVSLCLGGLAPWLRFAAYLPQLGFGAHTPGLWKPDGPVDEFINESLAAMFSRLVAPSHVFAATTISVVVLFVLSVLVISRASPEAASRRGLLAFSALMLVASPITYVHHSVFLFTGAAVALSDGLRARRFIPVAAIGGSLLFASIDFPELEIYGLHVASRSLGAIAFLAAFAVALWNCAWRDEPTTQIANEIMKGEGDLAVACEM